MPRIRNVISGISGAPRSECSVYFDVKTLYTDMEIVFCVIKYLLGFVETKCLDLAMVSISSVLFSYLLELYLYIKTFIIIN